MAYRDFKNVDSAFVEPDYTPLRVGIASLFQGLAAQREARKKNADQFKFDIGNAKFSNDDAIIKTRAFNAIQMMKNSFKKGEPTYNAEKELAAVQADKAQSDIQYQRMDDTLKRIDKRASEDHYYDPQKDLDLIKEATHGTDNDVDYRTRGERLDKADKLIGRNPESFKVDQYTADWVKTFGEKEKTRTIGNPNATSTIYNSSPFWNAKTGKPEVTDEHAVQYLKSRPDGMVQLAMEDKVGKQLDDEITKMKSLGKDPRTEWMNGKSDVEIKNELISDPKKNLINQQDFGVRVRDLAKQKLNDSAKISQKVDVEYKKDTSKTGGLYNNDAIAHSNTLHTEDVGSEGISDRVAGAFRMGKNTAPGGILMINKGVNTGKPISFDASSSNIFNINSGTTSRGRGSSPFNLTGYQVQGYYKDGRPYVIDAGSQAELLNHIKNIPAEDRKNLEPEMSIALKGYTLDRGKMLGDVRTSIYDLNNEYSKAVSSGDIEKQAKIQGQLSQLDEFRQQLNSDSDDYTDEDILNAAASKGITSIRTDQLLKADRADIDRINTITEGLNLWDKNKWSPEMKQAAEVWKNTTSNVNTPEPVKQEPTYLIKGYEYTEKELLDSGLTKERIQSELKSGKLKKK